MGIRNRLLCNRAVWRCPSGHIRSIDDPITQYAPQLAGGAYDEVTVRNLLQMASGVKWDEEAQKPGAILSFMARLPREVPPGTRFNYSTGETQVAAAVLRGAVKRPLADYLSERIWAKFGMESMQPGGWSHQTGLKSVGAAYRQLCAITGASVSSCSPEGTPVVNRFCLTVGYAMHPVPKLSVHRMLITGTCCGRFRTPPPPFMKARSKREVSSGSMCT